MDPKQYIEAAIHADLESSPTNLLETYTNAGKACLQLIKAGKKEEVVETRKKFMPLLRKLQELGLIPK